MNTNAIGATKGPEGRVALILTDHQGRLVSHLLRPEEAQVLARDLLALAGSAHAGSDNATSMIDAPAAESGRG